MSLTWEGYRKLIFGVAIIFTILNVITSIITYMPLSYGYVICGMVIGVNVIMFLITIKVTKRTIDEDRQEIVYEGVTGEE